MMLQNVSHKTEPHTIITNYGELILQLNCTYELATCTWSYAVFIPYLDWCHSYIHSHNNVKQVGTAYITGYMATEGFVKITLTDT